MLVDGFLTYGKLKSCVLVGVSEPWIIPIIWNDQGMDVIEPSAVSPPARPGDPDNLLRQLVAAWLLAQESDQTKVAYHRDILGDVHGMKVPGWLAWCAQRDLDPLTVRRAHIDTYRNVIQEAGYSPNTIARRLSVISSFYQYAADEKIIDHNPAKAVKRPRINRSVSHAVGLSEEELDRLLDAAHEDGARSAAIVSLLFFGGLRVGSVVAADIGDLGWSDGERTMNITTKGGEEDQHFLEGLAGDALNAYLAERGKPGKDEPLILNDFGKRIDQAYSWRLIRRLAREAKIPSWEKLGPHSLRHTYATHALDAGVPLVDVQDGLGHSDPKTTRRYDRARTKRGRRPGRVLAERRLRRLEERRDAPASIEEPGDDSA